ncbi:MAG: DUF2249 domain-containing protein [Intrasporangium sp.]|uniref:DUF2249 domain-containing protein n=1 Tax=Intrasporangium sp. TaxID=1925024 RepID=UPI002647E8A6|nr:DUF2249 domain-containing protein [Intrasporangium sp.]MDN5795620.1 DUF2249 domain-containing protein [Intrasporangium sp.]
MSTHDQIPLTEVKHGHSCGCGEEDADVPSLDARAIPHAIRHATVFGAFNAIPVGGALDLIAPHNPLPLLAQLQSMFGDIDIAYLEEGPEKWTLRLTRNG